MSSPFFERGSRPKAERGDFLVETLRGLWRDSASYRVRTFRVELHSGTAEPDVVHGHRPWYWTDSNFRNFGPWIASDSVATTKRIRRRIVRYVEDFATEERPKVA